MFGIWAPTVLLFTKIWFVIVFLGSTEDFQQSGDGSNETRIMGSCSGLPQKCSQNWGLFFFMNSEILHSALNTQPFCNSLLCRISLSFCLFSYNGILKCWLSSGLLTNWFIQNIVDDTKYLCKGKKTFMAYLLNLCWVITTHDCTSLTHFVLGLI